MYNASTLRCDEAVKKITESEFGILLLKADKKSMFDISAEKLTFRDRQGMFGNGAHITYHLFPLFYENIVCNLGNLVESRAVAVKNLFYRWTEQGYNKHHAKDPYNCKAFIRFLDSIEFLEADYMLLLVD